MLVIFLIKNNFHVLYYMIKNKIMSFKVRILVILFLHYSILNSTIIKYVAKYINNLKL